MQPHSMCAVNLSMYMWNRPDVIYLKSANVEVEYLSPRGLYRKLKYKLNIVSQKSDQEFTVHIIRDGGGIACAIKVWRNSDKEGSRVYQTHSQQHVSELLEEYDLYKKKLIAGSHRNSRKYNKFAGEILSPDRKKLRLISDIKHPYKDTFIPLSYTVELKNIIEK